MVHDRAALDTDSLVRILLVLVVVWLGLEVLEEALGLLLGPFSALEPLLGLVVLVLLLLYLTGRL